jgi:1-acyl-sn-glycerol-3-phosphate acyltransferase
LLRTLFILLWIVLTTGYLGTLCIVIAFISKSPDASLKIARIWAKGILFVASIKVKVNYHPEFYREKNYIYMSNHMSNFDIPVLLAHLPTHLRWLAKAELFKIPIFGSAMKTAGYISIDRSDRRSALKSLNQAAKNIKEGVPVLIFPEGTRSKENAIQPFKKGGFILAVDAGVPIVPVVIQGTWRIMPKKRFLVRPGKVILEVGKPIKTSSYNRKTKDDLMKHVRSVIIQSFERANKGNKSC